MYPPVVNNSHSLSSSLYFYIKANVRLMKVKYNSCMVKDTVHTSFMAFSNQIKALEGSKSSISGCALGDLNSGLPPFFRL